jgi:hypothetical protein
MIILVFLIIIFVALSSYSVFKHYEDKKYASKVWEQYSLENVLRNQADEDKMMIDNPNLKAFLEWSRVIYIIQQERQYDTQLASIEEKIYDKMDKLWFSFSEKERKFLDKKVEEFIREKF